MSRPGALPKFGFPVNVRSSDTQLITSLQFPANTGSAGDTMRLSLTGANFPSSQPFTLLWNLYPLPQATGYNTTFFFGSTNSPFESNGRYVGCHPYPDNFGVGPADDRHWEISHSGLDDITDENGNNTIVTGQTGRWYRQAMVITDVGSGNVRFDFYWDIAAGFTRLISATTDSAPWQSRSLGSAPALGFGDAPWNPGNEMLNGRLRAIQAFQASLNTTQIGTLSPLNTDAAVLASASSLSLSHWCLLMNPTLADVNDKSGNGRHFGWFNGNRPIDYMEAA